MPLGLFGGGTSSNKPQVLGNDGTSKKDSSKTLNESNCKGVSLKLTNTQVTIEKQLAEGGFAIVYLVSDKKNRKFALKRQFVLDNQKQLDACIRECKIVSDLRGHKNIVEYVDHMITMNKYGQYDCMLLTVYHKRNVLQLMNERISNNLHLSATEILNIFCNMCEAVARLHHSNTPVIHRDLKVENILIDERNRAAPPTFVLCDFGSATTKVMSINTQPVATIQDEIERNTTLCYRAPEMVDIYGGQPIGVPADMWSMGVMLYRLCYFSLPFEESALAIQNGNYTPFPAHPDYPAAIRAIIYLLLDVDVSRRLPIFECSSLAFEAYGKPLPIENVYGVKIPSLEQAIMDLKEGKPRNHTVTPKVFKEPKEEKKKQIEEVLISTNEPVISQSTTTSVNPRLRPKATSNILTGISANIPSSKGDEIFKKDNRQSFPGELEPKKMDTTTGGGGGPLSCPLLKPADLGFTDLVVDDSAIPRDRAATDTTGQRPPLNATSQVETTSKPTTSTTQQHRRNVSDTTQISKSAFKPYSQTAPVSSNVRSVEDMRKSTPKTETIGEWNPFLAAPFSNSPFDEKDDFGQAFDVLPRREATVVPDDDTSSIDSRDPFGAAPFDQLTGSQTSSSISSYKQTAHENEEKETEHIENVDMVDGRNGGTGEEEQGNTVQVETDSEVDEQRMYARRRYSYENIDGVGDDASSDSRGRTDRDDSEDDYYDDEDRAATTAATSATKRRGDADTSHDDDDDEDEDDTSSQNTVGSEDGGNRPLLEDDGLEDDDENEFFDNRLNAPLFIGTNNCTNPFLRDEMTPKMMSPNTVVDPPQKEPVKLRAQTHTDDEWDLGDRWSDRRDTIHHRPALESSATLTLFAPATLPRQQTPLTAWKPELPATAPVSIIPSMSTTSFPDTTNNVGDDATDSAQPCEPVVGTLISVGAPTEMPQPAPPPPPPPKHAIPTKTDALIFKNPVAAKIDFVEGPKTPKPTTKKKIRASVEPPEEENDSDLETDGSEAEIFASESSTQAVVKKKKKGFGLRSSHPSIGTGEFSTPVMKKSSKERKISSSAQKRASTGALNNASFVNTSFQYEDMDSPVQRF